MLPMIAATVSVTLKAVAIYVVSAQYVNRCSLCGLGFISGTPFRWCISGHKLHHTCVDDVMDRREVCPICRIYVSEK